MSVTSIAAKTWTTVDHPFFSLVYTELCNQMNVVEDVMSLTNTAFAPWMPVDAVPSDLTGDDDGTLQSGIRAWDMNIAKDLLTQLVTRYEVLKNTSATVGGFLLEWLDPVNNYLPLTPITVSDLISFLWGRGVNYESVQGHFDIIRVLRFLLNQLRFVATQETTVISDEDEEALCDISIDSDQTKVAYDNVTRTYSSSGFDEIGRTNASAGHLLGYNWYNDPPAVAGDWLWLGTEKYSGCFSFHGSWTDVRWFDFEWYITELPAPGTPGSVRANNDDSTFAIRIYSLTAAQAAAFKSTNDSASDPFAYEATAVLIDSSTVNNGTTSVASGRIGAAASTGLYIAISAENAVIDKTPLNWYSLQGDPAPFSAAFTLAGMQLRNRLKDGNGNIYFQHLFW